MGERAGNHRGLVAAITRKLIRKSVVLSFSSGTKLAPLKGQRPVVSFPALSLKSFDSSLFFNSTNEEKGNRISQTSSLYAPRNRFAAPVFKILTSQEWWGGHWPPSSSQKPAAAARKKNAGEQVACWLESSSESQISLLSSAFGDWSQLFASHFENNSLRFAAFPSFYTSGMPFFRSLPHCCLILSSSLAHLHCSNFLGCLTLFYDSAVLYSVTWPRKAG